MEKLTFYGTRGSRSLTSEKYMTYGGATTCLLLNLNNTYIMVDCGSGITNAINDLKNIDELYLFISHTHLDHIAGIPTLFSSLENTKIHIYGKTFNNVSIKDSITKIMNQDLWPVRAETYKNVDFNELEDDLVINNIKISNMDSNHPGGCSIFRFDYLNDSIVTAFDFSHLDNYDDKLIEFSKGANTLIYDGSILEEDFDNQSSYGHSTPNMGSIIGKKLKVKELIITHYGLYDDETLYNLETKLKSEYPFVSFAKSGYKNDDFKKFVEIGSLLATEKDNDTLLLKIVETEMELTSADGGTLYLLNKDKLDFKVLINKSKNIKLIKKDSPLDIPSVALDGRNVSAESARTKKLINIEDCYNNELYDFTGTKEYDKLNNYRTKSVLVIPLLDEYNDVVGVLQLINAHDNLNNVVSFRKSDEEMLSALANQAGMSIVNSLYSTKINELLYGFVKVMSVEIDERTPYNANHTRNMVKFASNFFEYENKVNGKYKVDEKKNREILMSIWLHDIGKILTPLNIMNKDDRLGELLPQVLNRFSRRELLLKLSLAKNEISVDKYNELEKERVEELELINTINKTGFLSHELQLKLDDLSLKIYEELDGSIKPVITMDEYHELSITKGTLTFEERKIMQDHVSYTQKILSQLNFPKYYDMIPVYAGNHHEFLNGSGYPNHLTEVDLPWPCRLITICDIFEALIAKDRPYKKPLPIEVAIKILNEMADNKQLDKDLIDEFVSSKAWE